MRDTCFETLYHCHTGDSCANNTCTYWSDTADQQCMLTHVVDNLETGTVTTTSYKDCYTGEKQYGLSPSLQVRDIMKLAKVGQGTVLYQEQAALHKLKRRLITTIGAQAFLDYDLPEGSHEHPLEGRG